MEYKLVAVSKKSGISSVILKEGYKKLSEIDLDTLNLNPIKKLEDLVKQNIITIAYDNIIIIDTYGKKYNLIDNNDFLKKMVVNLNKDNVNVNSEEYIEFIKEVVLSLEQVEIKEFLEYIIEHPRFSKTFVANLKNFYDLKQREIKNMLESSEELTDVNLLSYILHNFNKYIVIRDYIQIKREYQNYKKLHKPYKNNINKKEFYNLDNQTKLYERKYEFSNIKEEYNTTYDEYLDEEEIEKMYEEETTIYGHK